MDWLNYRHLHYFWLVAQEGGLVRAAAKSRVSHQTVGSQVRLLEQALGEKLFEKQGRRLVLTGTGRVVEGYADEIFGIGRDLQEALRGRAPGGAQLFRVGVADAMPKLVAEQLLRPARKLRPPVRIVCHEDRPENLFAQLALHALDVVLADAPVGGEVGVRAYNHLLGESPVGLFAGARLAHTLRRKWPQSLGGAPVVLPTSNTTLRRSLDAWFERRRIVPDLVAEIEDSALLQSFAADGSAVFPAPDAIAAALGRQYGLVRAGAAEGVRERFYVVSVQRRLTHPAVVAITEAARRQNFGVRPAGLRGSQAQVTRGAAGDSRAAGRRRRSHRRG